MISGHVYRRLGENRVEVTLQDGRTGIFDQYAEYIDGEVKSADIQMCSWVGGAICEGEEDTPMEYSTESPHAYRDEVASARREALRPQFGEGVEKISDADLVDAIYYSVFPNISPRGDFNQSFIGSA